MDRIDCYAALMCSHINMAAPIKKPVQRIDYIYFNFFQILYPIKIQIFHILLHTVVVAIGALDILGKHLLS